MKPTSLLLFFLPLLLGCARERILHVTGPYPDSKMVNRCLQHYASNFSTNATNHFYVGAVKPAGGFEDALVYWKEERTILGYGELAVDTPKGSECLAWHDELKLDRDTVDTENDIGGSTYLVTHRVWVEWMEQCLAHGREYVIRLDEARRLYPKATVHDGP